MSDSDLKKLKEINEKKIEENDGKNEIEDTGGGDDVEGEDDVELDDFQDENVGANNSQYEHYEKSSAIYPSPSNIETRPPHYDRLDRLNRSNISRRSASVYERNSIPYDDVKESVHKLASYYSDNHMPINRSRSQSGQYVPNYTVFRGREEPVFSHSRRSNRSNGSQMRSSNNKVNESYEKAMNQQNNKSSPNPYRVSPQEPSYDRNYTNTIDKRIQVKDAVDKIYDRAQFGVQRYMTEKYDRYERVPRASLIRSSTTKPERTQKVGDRYDMYGSPYYTHGSADQLRTIYDKYIEYEKKDLQTDLKKKKKEKTIEKPNKNSTVVETAPQAVCHCEALGGKPHVHKISGHEVRKYDYFIILLFKKI